jgi:outer membrane murein-binding lipoprotein Lpp
LREGAHGHDGGGMFQSVITAVVASTMLAGCGETWLNARLNHIDAPSSRLEDKTCLELNGIVSAASSQIQALEQLKAKAAEEWPGGIIGWVSYGPDLDKARATRFAAREVQVEKGCEGPELRGHAQVSR